MAEFR